jgi:hypothetical protein
MKETKNDDLERFSSVDVNLSMRPDKNGTTFSPLSIAGPDSSGQGQGQKQLIIFVH